MHNFCIRFREKISLFFIFYGLIICEIIIMYLLKLLGNRIGIRSKNFSDIYGCVLYSSAVRIKLTPMREWNVYQGAIWTVEFIWCFLCKKTTTRTTFSFIPSPRRLFSFLLVIWIFIINMLLITGAWGLSRHPPSTKYNPCVPSVFSIFYIIF